MKSRMERGEDCDCEWWSAGQCRPLFEPAMTDLPLQPTLEEFRNSAGKGNLVPVWVELTADYETPLSAFEKIGEGAPRFLFESAETTGFSGRYSFMGAHPRRVMTARGQEMKVEERGGEVRRYAVEGDPLAEVERMMSVYRPVPHPRLPAFTGGAVGCLTYDMVRYFEPKVPAAPKDELGLPEMVFMVADEVVIFDHRYRLMQVVVNVYLPEHASVEAGYEWARGGTVDEDTALAAELLADEKERAEHIMLVDLARNDVGRVSEFGTVEVTDLMIIERYSHVMHIVSNVTGKLAAGRTACDVMRATFPAGTVSGSPKVRAMQVINEMEKSKRCAYAGAVGYLGFDGNLDSCIALRTVVLTKGKAFVQAGAGIVADSVPESEYLETVNKAASALRAVERAGRLAGA